MHFKTVFATAGLFVASVTAQQSASPTTTTTPSSTGSNTTDLLTMVSELPTCALSCLEDAATDINCTAPDLKCLCSKSSELVAAIGPCLLLSSDCSSNDTNTIGSIAQNICPVVNTSSTSELDSASSAISSALGTETTGSSASTTNTAVHTGCPTTGMGLLGLVAAVAIVFL